MPEASGAKHAWPMRTLFIRPIDDGPIRGATGMTAFAGSLSQQKRSSVRDEYLLALASRHPVNGSGVCCRTAPHPPGARRGLARLNVLPIGVGARDVDRDVSEEVRGARDRSRRLVDGQATGRVRRWRHGIPLECEGFFALCRRTASRPWRPAEKRRAPQARRGGARPAGPDATCMACTNAGTAGSMQEEG
jgi:hypothetical protein